MFLKKWKYSIKKGDRLWLQIQAAISTSPSREDNRVNAETSYYGLPLIATHFFITSTCLNTCTILTPSRCITLRIWRNSAIVTKWMAMKLNSTHLQTVPQSTKHDAGGIHLPVVVVTACNFFLFNTVSWLQIHHLVTAVETGKFAKGLNVWILALSGGSREIPKQAASWMVRLMKSPLRG